MVTSSPPTSAPGTDKTGMDFRRILPEIRCQSCLSPGSEPTPRGAFSPLLGWAFGPRKFMNNCHADFIATHERPGDGQDWHGFPAHFAGNLLPVLSVPGFGAHSPRWFFEPVGMGLRPAKLHEKRRKPQEIPRCARWFFEPVPGFSRRATGRAAARSRR